MYARFTHCLCSSTNIAVHWKFYLQEQCLPFHSLGWQQHDLPSITACQSLGTCRCRHSACDCTMHILMPRPCPKMLHFDHQGKLEHGDKKLDINAAMLRTNFRHLTACTSQPDRCLHDLRACMLENVWPQTGISRMQSSYGLCHWQSQCWPLCSICIQEAPWMLPDLFAW